MKIKYCSILVDDQEKALRFYTEILGFAKKFDVPAGDFRWITLTSNEGSPDIELVLEPNENPAARTFQEAMFEQRIPLTSFGVTNIQSEYDRLIALKVVFRGAISRADWGASAMFEDTCGNLIQIQEIA